MSRGGDAHPVPLELFSFERASHRRLATLMAMQYKLQTLLSQARYDRTVAFLHHGPRLSKLRLQLLVLLVPLNLLLQVRRGLRDPLELCRIGRQVRVRHAILRTRRPGTLDLPVSGEVLMLPCRDAQDVLGRTCSSLNVLVVSSSFSMTYRSCASRQSELVALKAPHAWTGAGLANGWGGGGGVPKLTAAMQVTSDPRRQVSLLAFLHAAVIGVQLRRCELCRPCSMGRPCH